MPASIQALVVAALKDVAAVAHMKDEELLATEWIWTLRQCPADANTLTERELQSRLIEDLLLIESLEGQGRQLAQTIDGMTRFLDLDSKEKVIAALRTDSAFSRLMVTDEDRRVRLNPKKFPEALRLIGLN